MKKLILSITTICFIALLSCGDNTSSDKPVATTVPEATTPQVATPEEIAVIDPHRGLGKFDNVELGPINPSMAVTGTKVYEVKCASCHKLSSENLVGPGWAGVTERHTPEWIMNFLTNTDEMLDKDPKAKAMLEVCLVRMPNQNIDDGDARSLLEFMRKNDGAK